MISSNSLNFIFIEFAENKGKIKSCKNLIFLSFERQKRNCIILFLSTAKLSLKYSISFWNKLSVAFTSFIAL
ncbi:MAG: hypothetical protein LBC61_06595 [Candidatus Peribacteria bacterium]|nr:hypothetical protein [Candidatus Peribacteria bacterium]